MDCSKITQGFLVAECDGPAIAGTSGRVVLVSYTDIDRTKSTEAGNVISAIVLKAGAKGYAVDSLPNAVVGDSPLTAGTYLSTFQHTLTVRIFKKSEAAKKFVNQLSAARVVAIVENNERGAKGEVKYEVYGWRSGLVLTELAATTEMTDNVAYQIGLGSSAAAQERSLPMSFFNTDEATTDEAVEALLGSAA